MRPLRLPPKRARSSGSGPNPTQCFAFVLCLVVSLLLVLVLFLLRDGGLPTIFGDSLGASGGSSAALQQYDAALERARILSLRYRNMTGKSHPIAQEIVKLHGAAGSSAPAADQVAASSSLKGALTAKATEPPKEISAASELGASSATAKGSSVTAPVLKDLVLGMAQDTDPKNFAVFASSLRKVTQADIVVFVNMPAPARQHEIAKANSVTLVPFELSSLEPSIQNFHPSTLRWPLFFRYLQNEEVRKQYGRIWMVDVRDSFFQSDPFLMLPLGQRGFHVFQGVESIPIQECGWNSGWIKDCFGSPTLQEVGGGTIICSGVSMGDASSVYEYLTLMDDIIMARGKSAAAQIARFPRCERNGVDQGIHNVLVHKKLIPNLKVFAQSSGPVANLQAQKARVSSSGEVFNQNGDVVPVVHQYDRRPDLQKGLFSKHVYWIDTNDAEAEWKAEEACKPFTPKADVDMFKGVCDLKSQGGATSAASCCAFCQKRPGCKAFTFYSSVCFLKSCSVGSRVAALPGAVSAAL